MEKDILWLVNAADNLDGLNEEVQFIEYNKEDALQDVKDNRCDFCEHSFKYCKIQAKQVGNYLGFIDETFKLNFEEKPNPYKTIYFKMNFEKYDWEELPYLQYKQEVYDYWKERTATCKIALDARMMARFGTGWKEGLIL